MDGRGRLVKSEGWELLALAGLCGGIAEVIWIGIYSAFAPVDITDIARQVTASLLPQWAYEPQAPALGLVIHLTLSVLLGIGFGWAVWAPFRRFLPAAGSVVLATATLMGVWAINFFVVLPLLNPVFVGLLPYTVTLLSKVLFGITMALALNGGSARQLRLG
jgi:hypothetical protein